MTHKPEVLQEVDVQDFSSGVLTNTDGLIAVTGLTVENDYSYVEDELGHFLVPTLKRDGMPVILNPVTSVLRQGSTHNLRNGSAVIDPDDPEYKKGVRVTWRAELHATGIGNAALSELDTVYLATKFGRNRAYRRVLDETFVRDEAFDKLKGNAYLPTESS